MSISYNISGAKSAADKKKKSDEYKTLLMLRAKANEKIAKALEESDQNRLFNIPAKPAPYKSAEDDIKDLVLQRDIAYKSLRQFMKESDAFTVLQTLQVNDELDLYNRFSSQLLTEIGNQTNITPAVFSAIWDRFKLKLASTVEAGTPTGIVIGAQKGEYDTELAKIRTAIGTASTSALPMILDTMRTEAGRIAGLDEKDIDTEFEKAYEAQTGNKIDDGRSTIEVFNAPGTKIEKYLIVSTASDTTGDPIWSFNKMTAKGGLAKTIEPDQDAQNIKVRYIVSQIYGGIPLGIEVIWTGDPKTVKIPPSRISATAPLPRGSTLSRFTSLLTGTGMENATAQSKVVKPRKSRNRECGMNIKNTPNFGKYYMSENYLNKGYILLRRKTGSISPITPKPVLASSKLINIIKDIIYSKSYDEEEFKKLNETEQRLFDDLLSFCKLDKLESIDFYKHKKYSDKERDEIQNRYRVLTGQLEAGNNNKEILKELKLLLFKMAEMRIITKADYNKVIHNILLAYD